MNLTVEWNQHIWGFYVYLKAGREMHGGQDDRAFHLECWLGLKNIGLGEVRVPGIGQYYYASEYQPGERWLFDSWGDLVATDKAWRERRAAYDAEMEIA